MIKIGTHNGTFHCDEVFACVLLKQLSRYRNAEIVRSRDQTILDKCDIVVDVGGVFDHSKHRYDHHHRSFQETFKSLNSAKPWDIKLSSAGLVYAFFGKEILSEIAIKHNSDIDIEKLYDKIYENLVMGVDAIDNGVPLCDGEPRYKTTTNLSSLVGNLNPWWNSIELNEETQFTQAMVMVEREFIDEVEFYLNCWWPARQMVKDAVDRRFEVHESGAIIKFTHGKCPWKSHFFDIETEMFSDIVDGTKKGDNEKKILFVLYSDNDNWSIQCVPVSNKKGAENRLGIHEKWKGMRDEILSTESGIPGCLFVHTSGFKGSNRTYEGALKMAVDTLQYASEV